MGADTAGMVLSEAPHVQDDTLELRSYQNVVRGELGRLGFREAGSGAAPALKVGMRFSPIDVPVRVLEPVYPHYYPSMRFYAHPFYRSPWGGRRYGGMFYSPFYDPFWYGTPAYQETIVHHYKRQVQVGIKSIKDGKRLFDVTVNNMSRNMSTPEIMPALVQSAFAEFPGVSGVARTVELKREPK